ncbi:MAG: hypothetical protein FWE80_04480, partial [Oscillospiraceae bacterium]|nr:hypothetical protein [Oscillospiraceae bacterium]
MSRSIRVIAITILLLSLTLTGAPLRVPPLPVFYAGGQLTDLKNPLPARIPAVLELTGMYNTVSTVSGGDRNYYLQYDTLMGLDWDGNETVLIEDDDFIEKYLSAAGEDGDPDNLYLLLSQNYYEDEDIEAVEWPIDADIHMDYVLSSDYIPEPWPMKTRWQVSKYTNGELAWTYETEEYDIREMIVRPDGTVLLAAQDPDDYRYYLSLSSSLSGYGYTNISSYLLRLDTDGSLAEKKALSHRYYMDGVFAVEDGVLCLLRSDEGGYMLRMYNDRLEKQWETSFPEAEQVRMDVYGETVVVLYDTAGYRNENMQKVQLYAADGTLLLEKALDRNAEYVEWIAAAGNGFAAVCDNTVTVYNLSARKMGVFLLPAGMYG